MNIRLGTGMLSRVLAAASNFLLTWFLINNLTLENYGYFSTIFAMCVFVTGLFSSFFVSQMVALGSRVDKTDRINFSSRYLHAIKLSLLVSGILVFLFAYVSGYIKSRETFLLFIAITVALWVLVLREFLTVTCYFVERFYIPLFANCIGLLALLLYLFFVVPSESFLKVTLGFEIIGVYILPGLIVYIYTLFTGKLNSYTLPINELFSSSFRDGKWALLQGLFYFIRTQSRTMISLLILSAWHVGLINAAYLMVALPIVMISGLVQQALPQLTSLSFESGEYKKNIILLIAVIAALTLFYAAFIFAFHEILTEKLLSPEILLYSGFPYLVFSWLMIMFFQAINMGFFTIIQSMNEFRLLASINFSAATLSLLASSIGAFYLDINGVMGAMVVTEFYVFSKSLLIIKGRLFS